MNTLEGRVAIITGAGRGIGRQHALLFAAEGAKVVVNDLGGDPDGKGDDTAPAQQVVDEIAAAGGKAIANYDDVSDWDGAGRLVQQAIDTFGDLHVLVNNAGILRDRMLVKMRPDEWDDIMRVHLRGHFCPTRHAAAYWREQASAGHEIRRSVINTSSGSGLRGNAGQTNYGAAKAGIASFTIIANMELARYGVRVNAIAPAAVTRLNSELFPEWNEDPKMDPANISPFVAYLATEDCPINGRIFAVFRNEVHLYQPFAVVDKIVKDGRWTVEELAKEAPRLQEVEFQVNSELIAIPQR